MAALKEPAVTPDVWQTLLQDHTMILIISASLIGASALLVICKVCQCCWLRRYCPLRAKYASDSDTDNKDYDLKVYKAEDNVIKSPMSLSPSYSPKNTLSPRASRQSRQNRHPNGPSPRSIAAAAATGRSASTCSSLNAPRHSHDITYGSTTSLSPNSSNCGTPTKHGSFASGFSNGSPSVLGRKSANDSDSPAEKPPSVLDFALHYNDTDGKLAIYIKGAKNLQPNLYGVATDCLLRIVLVRDMKRGWIRKQPSNLSVEDITSPTATFDTVEFRTQQHRRTLNPVFNEYFNADLREKDRRYATLKLAVCSVDRVAGGKLSVQAECHVNLAKADCSDLKDFTLPLRPYRPELGELMITLSYLPTAERVCVTVAKAAHLRLPLSCGPSLPNAFVKASLIQRGKTVGAKQKTAVRWGTTTPEFQEALTFDVPQAELDRVILLLTVVHQDTLGADKTRNSVDDARKPSTKGGDKSSSSGNNSGRGVLSDDAAYANDWTPGGGVGGGGLKSRRKSVGNYMDAAGGGDSSPGRSPAMSKSRSATSVHQRRGVCIGRLALGAHVPDGSERSHWRQMAGSPRTQVTHWHKLVP